mmetsp:Transcript_13988/g.39219  ORF Transcript_13988/g.39219 Transcript_13988/m.39219 type:complete len:505 (+) Transcript_13988:167-1681(+)
MKYSSVLYISCLLVAIDRPCYIHAEGIFGKLKRFVTGGGGNDNKNNNKNNNTNNINISKRRNIDGNNNAANNYPTTRLSNGVDFPLVGLGVGNMRPQYVPAVVSHGLQESRNIRLIDTAHVSKNEFLVAKGIAEGVDRILSAGRDSKVATTTKNKNEKVEVHVITKVWYTHLGYERTLQSAKASLQALKKAVDHPNIDLKVHLLLHWPRCYDEISWMDCNGEEGALPEEIKKAGPPPHLEPQKAWKDSWKALEYLVTDNTNAIASIGVSNFHRRELEELVRFANIMPHLVETNTWSLLYDPLLIDFCHKQNVHVVAHNLIKGVLYQAELAPFASHHLLSVANDLTKTMREDGLLPAENAANEQISAAQVVLAWLVQHSISVIPRTTSAAHMEENSAVALSKIPAMDDNQVQIVAQSVEALISGEDLTEDAFVTLTFHAKSKDVFLYWHDPKFGGEIEIAKIQKGKSFQESSHPGHQFKIYDVEGGGMEFFKVVGNYGEHKHIEL